MKALLDFIGHHESRNNPDAVWARISVKDRPKRPLTTMTIGEVLAWQDSIDAKYQSEAAGEFQFLEDTLRGLPPAAGLTTQSLFNKANQDRLATVLLKRRGLDLYLADKLSAEGFANNLAMEWASLPVVTDVKKKLKNGTTMIVRKGSGYYDGDGLNKSLTDVGPFLAAVHAAKHTAPVRPDVEPLPPKAQGWLAGLVAAILNLFRRRK